MPTIGDAITGALQDLGVLGAGETPTGDDLAVGLSRVNDWLDGLTNEGLTIYTITRTTWTIVAGTTSYGIGTGQTINIARPVSPNVIQAIGYLDTSVTPNLERLVGGPLTEDQYAGLAYKAQAGVYPTAFYYNATFPAGALKPYPVPTSTTLTGVIYTPTPVGTFTVAADDLTLPPGYRRFVRTHLALEIAPAFGASPSDEIKLAARESKAILKRTNLRLLDMRTDRVAFAGPYTGGYNITIDA